MRSFDFTYRRMAAANAILQEIQLEQPDAVRQLRLSVGTVASIYDGGRFTDATLDAVDDWCDRLNLRCREMHFPALVLALTSEPNADPTESS